jgi:uncharacterized protein (DUF433 family)
MTIDTTQSVPLTLWEDGTIRVTGTRLLLDMIINAHKQGDIPEIIAESFPSVSVAEVYAIIAYYLNNKEKIEKYLAEQEKEAEEIKKKLESIPGYTEKQLKFDEILNKRRKNLK